MKICRTGISAAYWCDPAKNYEYKQALLTDMTRAPGAEQTAWFDELFEGGLRIPDKGAGAAMTLLITGPPGTGKSTLTLELCYRLALVQPESERLRSLYFTTEGHAPWLIDHAREFGWDREMKILGHDTVAPVCIRSLKTEQDFGNYIPQPGASEASSSSSSGITDLLRILHEKFFGHQQTHQAPQSPPSPFDYSSFDLIVFDNLNTVRIDKGRWFQVLADLGASGPRLVVVVLDAPRARNQAKTWEYLADVVIRMDHAEPGGYLIRTIEIVKSRYQRSALGRHQVRVQEAFPPDSKPVNDRWALMRHHPFREEGGIFIYPSMHFILSRHKYLHPSHADEAIETPFRDLNRLLRGGFRPGRCAALIGGGGTHKSRLAFVQLLFLLGKFEEARGIIISLGEEEESTIKLLKSYSQDQFNEDDVDSFVESGRLEVAYYPPGFITPEEFFHRLQLSIARQRTAVRSQAGAPQLVIFNSLNLLHSHFPLCADHEVFIPAVIELLGHEGVTSLFVAPTQPDVDDDYGLLSLADPILEFARTDEGEGRKTGSASPRRSLRRGRHQAEDAAVVQLTVGRFAFGTSAGERLHVVLGAPGSKHPGLKIFDPSGHGHDNEKA